MSILVIDDEAGLRRSLCAYLEDRDFTMLEAANGREGLDVLDKNLHRLEAVIVDLNMPVMDGYSFIQEAVHRSSELPLIVLSGVGIVEDALKAVRLGAWDFITKPLHNFEILDYILDKALQKARLLRENRLYQTNLEQLVHQRTAELEMTRRQVMQRLSRAAEYKDNETGRHVIRVGEISALLGRAVGLGEERCEMLRECAPLHDVGKIGIPDEILLKPGRFTESEWKVMQLHCMYGCEILGPLTSKDEAHESCIEPVHALGMPDTELLGLSRILALLHHERMDGKGYPFGLAGAAIPLDARVVAVVDVFDALSSDRPYKQAFPAEKCHQILREGSGTQFDPQVVEAFFRHTEEVWAIRERWRD